MFEAGSLVSHCFKTCLLARELPQILESDSHLSPEVPHPPACVCVSAVSSYYEFGKCMQLPNLNVKWTFLLFFLATGASWDAAVSPPVASSSLQDDPEQWVKASCGLRWLRILTVIGAPRVFSSSSMTWIKLGLLTRGPGAGVDRAMPHSACGGLAWSVCAMGWRGFLVHFSGRPGDTLCHNTKRPGRRSFRLVS